MPAGIDSPGYVEEQRNKPRITKKIEEDDVVLSPESVAKSLLAGTSGRCSLLFLLVHPIRGETPSLSLGNGTAKSDPWETSLAWLELIYQVSQGATTKSPISSLPISCASRAAALYRGMACCTILRSA